MGFDITKGQRPSKNLSNSTEEEKKDPRYLYNSDEIILDDKPVETVVTDSNGNPMPAPRHNTLGSLSNLIEAQENAYEDYGGNRFTMGQDADPSLNESYYDKYANTYEDYQDLNEVRAREQGFWSKFGSSLGKFGVETVNTAVGNIVGLAVGAYQGIVNEYDDDPNTTFFSGMWNNSATQMQDALRKTVDEALPLYKSKKEAEMSPLRYMGTWNFWMENIASAGFTAGMLLSTALTGGMGLSSLTASLVRKAGASPNTVNMFYRLMAGIVGSASESSMEALNNYNDLKDAYTNDINNKYKEQVINVNKDIQLEAINIYNEALNSGTPIDMATAVRQARNNHLDIISEIEANRAAELDGVEQRALSGGSMTFGLNMAILGLSNTMGTLSYLKAPSVNAERQIKKGLAQRAKELIMPNPEKPLGEGISKLEARAVALRETLSEGFEESNQKWASELAKQYYGSDYDPNSAEYFSRFLEKAGKSFSDTYSNAETWKEFLAGAVTGAFGTFNPAGLSKLVRGGATASDFWQGGIIEAWREGGKLAERSQKAYDEMNKLMTNKKLQDNFRLGVFNLASKERQMQAAARGDKFAYENENDAQTIRMVQTFANAGELTALNNLIGDNDNISDEELNALSEGLTEKNEKKYGDNKYHSDYSFLLTDNGERISDITDSNDPRRAEAKEKIKKESNRIKNIIKEYQKAVNEADARTGYSLEQKELNLIAWGLTQAKNWEERINSMRDKIGDKYNKILTAIKGKLDSYKVNLNNFEEGKNELKKEILNIDDEIRKDPDNAELKAQRKEIVSALNDFSKLTKELGNQQKFVEAYSNLIAFLNGETEDKNGSKLDGLSVLSATVLNNTSKTHNVYQELAKTLDDISESEVSYNDKKDFLNMLKDMNKCANAIHHVSNHMNKLMDNKDELQHTFDAFNDEFLNERVDAYGKAYAESLKNLPAKVERDIVGEIRDNFDKIMDYYKQQYDKYIRPVEEKLNEIQQRIDEAKAITKDYAELNKLQKEKVNYERRLKVLRSFRSKFAARIKKIKKAAENAMKDLNPESKELLDAIDETNRLLAEFLPEAIDAINSNDASFREMNTLPAIIRREEIRFQNESDDSASKEEYIAKLLDRWQRDKQNEVFNKTKQFLFNLVFWAYKNHFTPLLLNEMEYYKIAHEIGMNISDVTDTKTLRDRVAFVIAKKILDFDRNDRKKLNPHYSPKLIAIERQKPDESLSISGTSSTTGVPLNISDVQDVEFTEYNSDGSVRIPELDPMQDITEDEMQRSLEQEKLDFARAIVDNVLLEDKKKYVAELAAMRRRKANKEGLIDRMLQVIAEEEDIAVEELIKQARNEIKREKARERREELKRQKEAEIVEKQKQQLRAKILAEIEEIRAEKRKLEEETKAKLKEKIQEIESMAESTKDSAMESVTQSINELEAQSNNLKQQADVISSVIEEIRDEKDTTAESLKGAIDTAITAITNESDDLKESLKGSVKSIVDELRTRKKELDKKLEEAQKQDDEQGSDGVKGNFINANGEVNWEYFEQILNNYHNSQPDSMFAKGRTTLATRPEKHFEGEGNTLNHIKFVTQSMLDLFEGKFDVDLPFVSEARASLQNQKDLMILAAMFHDVAKPYRHGDIHGWESADILRDIIGVDYNNRLAEWSVRHHMAMPFSHKSEFNLSNPEAIEVARNMARDAKRVGIDAQTAINAFVLINAADIINGREITVEDNWAKKAKVAGSIKYGDDISVKAVLTTELKEKVDLLKKAFEDIENEDLGNPEQNYRNQSRFDYVNYPEGGRADGKLPYLNNIDDNDISSVFNEENHIPMLAFTRSMTPMRFGSDGQMHKTEGFDNIFELQEIKDAFDFVNSGRLDKLVKENAEHNEYTEVYVQKKDEYDDIAFLYVKDNEGEYRCIGFLAKGKSYVSNNIVTEDNQYQFGYWIDEEGKNHYPSIALPRKKNGERQIGNQITSIENQNGEPFRILGTLKGSETNSTSFIPLTDARVGNVSIKEAFENGDITIVFVKNGSTEAIDIFNDNKIRVPESAYPTIDGSSVQNFVCVYPNTDHILFRRISYNYSAINMSGMSVSDITNGDDEVLKDLVENITVIAKNLVDFVNSRRGAGSQISASDEKEFGELFYKRMQNLFIPKCAGWFPKFKVNKKTGAIFGCYANAVTTDNKTLLTLNIPLSGKSQNELVDYIVETIFNQIKQGGFRNVVTKSPNGETVIETISCFNEGTVIYIKPNINLSNRGNRNFDTYSKYFSVNPNDGNNNIGRENGNFYVGFSGTEEYHSVNPFDSYKKTTGEQKKSSKISIGTANNYVFVQIDENDSSNNNIVNKNGESISNDELLSIADPNNIVDNKTIVSTLRNKLVGHILNKSTKVTIDINDEYYFDTNTFTIQKRINKSQIDWNKEFKEATVIWAHPTAGKTTLYEKGDSRVIDFDSVAKPEIAEAFGLPKSTSAKDLSIYCTGLNASKEIKDKYYRLLDEKLDEYTKKAKKEGKKLLVSDMRFIRNRKNDIDIVVTMSADKFAKGMATRGENRADGWKDSIDSNVAEYRNIFGKVYDMSDDESEHFEQVLNKYTEKPPVVEDVTVVDLGDGGFGEELFREVVGADEESLSLSIGDYAISDFISIVESIKGIDSDIVNFIRRHIGLNTRVKVVSDEEFELLKVKRKKPNATGFYNKTDDIVVIPKSASAKTLIHELVHPMTMHMLDYVFKHQEIVGNRDILSAINELINEISDAYDEDPSVFAGTNIEYVFSKRGASAAKELFSEVMSDEVLQNALARTKSKSSYTLFDRIREIINDILKIFGYKGNVRDFTSLFDKFKKIARNTEVNYELANPTKGDTASRIVKEVGDDAIDFCKRLGFSTVFNTENAEVVVDFVNKVMTFPDLSDRSFNVALSKVCAVLMPDDLLQEIRKVAELNGLDASPATLSRDILKVIEGKQSGLLGNLKGKLSNHISNIFDKIFKNDNYYMSLINKAVNEIIDKNSKYYNTAVKEGFELKTLDMDKLYSNEHYNIYRTLVNLGAALDGSAALRMQGTLYRSGEEDFHDLDFTMKFNNFSWQVRNAVDDLVKTYKTLTKNYLYKDKGVYKNLKEGHLASLTAELKKTPIYKMLSSEYADIRVRNFGKSDLGLMVTLEFDGYPVDIFYTEEVKKKVINGFVLADFTSAIGAKLVMGREKDIRDIINFKKYDIAEIEKQSDEELNDFCQKNGYDVDEFKKILVPLQSEIKKC